MKADETSAKSIDDYIVEYPLDVQVMLEQVRSTIRKAAPSAEEAIKYQIPTFTLNGNLVHFAAFKNHIGFYPGPSGIKEFQQALSSYKSAKGSVQFPFDRLIPLSLITRIVKFRIKEAEAKSTPKKKTAPKKK